MDSKRSQLSLPERAILAGELKSRIKRLQGSRTNRDGSRHSDAKWRAKLTHSFNTLREICCPNIQDRTNGKNVRRAILEQSMDNIKDMENKITQTHGAETLDNVRHIFELLEHRFAEQTALVPRSSAPKSKSCKRSDKALRRKRCGQKTTLTVVNTEDNVPEGTEPVEETFLSTRHTCFGCTEPELDRLKALMDKTPDKGDVMHVRPHFAPVKWSLIRRRKKCCRKLEMESVAEDYMATSDELKKEPNENENVAKLSQLSGDDVLEYFEGSKKSGSQLSQLSNSASPPPKKTTSFEFDEKLVSEFLKKEGDITSYTPSQEDV